VLEQPLEGELPIPGPVLQEKVSELVAVLTPLGASITGPTTVRLVLAALVARS
jgi:hypothetical protein